MTRVLYISDSLKQRFGVTSVILNYLEYINKNITHVDLLVYDDSEPDIISKVESFGSNVFFMPKLLIKNFHSFINFYKYFFKEHSYDIVHSHFNQIDGIVFPIARKNGVKCCISHSHNTRLSDYPLKEIRNRLLCLNIRSNADVWAACSVAAGKALFGKDFETNNKKLIIHNGIDCKKYTFNPDKRKKIRGEFNIDDKTILLGNVGSFKLQKNQSFLVDVFSYLCRTEDRFLLMLVGDGPTKVEIEKKVNELGIRDKVIFTGVRRDVPSVLSALDAFILPSLYEGLPVIGIEAQAAGLECVFSDSITKEVDFSNIHFESLDSPLEDWAYTVKSLDFKHNSGRASLVAKNGYDIAVEAKALCDTYKRLVKD